MGVNNGCGLEGILARLRNPLKRTGLAIALAAGLLGSTIAKAEWAPPTDLVELNSGSGEQMGSLSSDGLTLYFSHDETGGDVDIWYATRPDTNSPWATRMPVIEVNTPAIDDRPVIANDGNTLYFHSNSGGNWDIYYAIRSDSSSPFSAPQQLNEVNSPAVELMGALSCDGRTIYFSSDRIGGMGSGDIYAATRIDTSSPFGSPLNLTEVNSSDYDSGDSISADDLELYITRQPPDTNNTDVYRATRADPSASFGAPIPVTDINTTSSEQQVGISFDGTELYFTSGRNGGTDIWKTTRAMGTGNCATPPEEGCADGKWSIAMPVAELNSENVEANPSISKDGRTLYWDSNFSIWQAQRANSASPFALLGEVIELRGFERPAISSTDREIFLHGGGFLMSHATRATPIDVFDAPVPLSELNTIGGGRDATISSDGQTLFYGSRRGSENLWQSERSTLGLPFAVPQELDTLDPMDTHTEWAPAISSSGLQLYLTSNLNTSPDGHLYVTERRRIGNPWGAIVKITTNQLPDANGDYLPGSQGPAISTDGTELFFYRWEAGDADLYRVIRCRSEVDQDLDGQTLDRDCNDSEPRAKTGAEEVCDFVDNDCDGVTDGGVRPGEVSSLPVNLDLRLSKSAGLLFSWENMNNCATAYNIYEGRIGNFYSHLPLQCHVTTTVPSADGRRLEFLVAPSSGNRYYLITASNAVGEGTSGYASSGMERNPSFNACGPF